MGVVVVVGQVLVTVLAVGLRVALGGVGAGVPQEEAAQSDSLIGWGEGGLVILQDSAGQERNDHPRVALACDEEVLVLQVLELPEEGYDCLQVVVGQLVVRGFEWACGETGQGGRLHEQNIDLFVPVEGIGSQGLRTGSKGVRSLRVHHTVEGRAAWA